MSKEGNPRTSQELENEAFNRILLFAGFAVTGAVFSCASPVFIGPTLLFLGGVRLSYKHYKNLTKSP